MSFNVKSIVAVVIMVASQIAFAEEVKVVKVGRPLIVNIDRRPDKNIRYSKCVGNVKTEKGDWLPVAVSLQGDRVCPAADSIVLDVTEEKNISDSGNTEVSNFFIDKSEFDRTYAYKGKTWKLNTHPSKIVAKVKEEGESKKMIEDIFYSTNIVDVSSDETMEVISDKAGSIAEMFETMHRTEKPLAIGNAAGTPHAAAGSKVVHK